MYILLKNVEMLLELSNIAINFGTDKVYITSYSES